MPPDCAAAQPSSHRSLFQINLILLCKSHRDCCLPPPLCIPLARLLRNAAFSFQPLNGSRERPTHTKQLWSRTQQGTTQGSQLGSCSLAHSLSPLVRKLRRKQAFKVNFRTELIKDNLQSQTGIVLPSRAP